MTNALSFFWICHGIFMTKSSDQPGENDRYINRSLSLDGIGEAGCILKYAEAYTIAPSHIARWLSPGIYCRSWLHTATHSSPLPPPLPSHSWTKSQNPVKNLIQKFVKPTDHTCACNDLTSFEYEVHTMTGNGSYVNLKKLAWQNSWNHIKWITFSASFSHMKPLCAV